MPFKKIREVFGWMPPKRGGESGSDAQKRAPASSPNVVGDKEKTSTPRTSDRSTKTNATNLNLD